MKLLFILFCLWIGNDFSADATRVPAKCGNDVKFFELLPHSSSDRSEDKWATNYHGLMFVATFKWETDQVKWTVKYKTRSNKQEQTYKHKFKGVSEWVDEQHDEHPIFKTGIKTAYTKQVTTGLSIKPGSNLTEMEVSFYAKDKRWFGLGEKTCSIKDIKFQDCEAQFPELLLVQSQTKNYGSKGTFYCANGTGLFPVNQPTETTCEANAEWKNDEIFDCYEECETEPPLLVASNSSTYLSEGQFVCENGFDIYPLDKTSHTVCMENKQWKNEEGFQCYQAPNDTRIEGNLEVKENETMEVLCNFTENPFAYRSKYSFDGEVTVLDENEPFIRNVTIEDDGKDITCTPTAKVGEFSQEGKSDTRKITIIFGPRSRGINNEGNHKCNWIIGVENSCYFTYQSRPAADSISLFAVNNGSESEVEFKFSSSSDGDIHTISINKIQENALGPQMFKLRILSSVFPQHPFTIEFELIVATTTSNHDKEETIKTQDGKLAIILTVCGIFVAVVTSILIAVIIKRRRNKKETPTITDGGIPKVRASDIYGATGVVRDDSEREERLNIIYNTGNVGDESDGAQERINVIYQSGDVGSATDDNIVPPTQPDQVYATIGPKKKKTTPQQGSNDLYATIDVNKKKKKVDTSATTSATTSMPENDVYTSKEEI